MFALYHQPDYSTFFTDSIQVDMSTRKTCGDTESGLCRAHKLGFFIMNFLTIWRCRALRRVMRGSRRLRSAGKSDLVERCYQAVIGAADCDWSPIGGGVLLGREIPEAALRRSMSQYLSFRIGLFMLPEAILYAHGRYGTAETDPIICVLPLQMRRMLARQGLAVAHIRSHFLWTSYVVLMWVYGLRTSLRLLVDSRSRLTAFPAEATHVSGIGPDNIAQESLHVARASLDLLSWITKNLGKPERPIFHSVASRKVTTSVTYVSDALPGFATRSERLHFGLWVTWAPFLVLCAAILGRWQDAFFLHETALAARLRIARRHSLPAEYLFTSSNLIFRPLWTHIAEVRGSKIRAVLYSTNVESFQREGGKLPPSPEYRYMNWPCYFVWNQQQADFLKRVIGEHPQVEVVGNVWFSDSDAPLPKLPTRSIAYFDVQPKRESWIEPRGFAPRYYTAETSRGSLATLLELAEEMDFYVVYKQKRKGGPFDNPVFSNYLKGVASNKRLTTVDPALAPQHLIEEVKAVVSMPWTSTANIATGMGRPSCYFDWTGILQRNDPAAHGAPILQDKQALRAWLTIALNSDAIIQVEDA